MWAGPGRAHHPQMERPRAVLGQALRALRPEPAATDGAPPPEGAIRANDAAQNPERDAHYAPHRSIVEYTPGQTMHLFHPKDFCPEYDASVPVPAMAFFPGGGFRACG